MQQQQPRPVAAFRFSTADIPASERRDAVCALRERGVLPIEPLPDGSIAMQIAKLFLPGAAILSGMFCGLRQDGTPRAPDASDDLFLGINLLGHSLARQRGDEIAIGDGDAVLLSCAVDAFSLVRPTPARFVGLRVPRKAIAPLVSGLDDRTMRRIPAATPALRLLTGYLDAIAESSAMESAESSSLVAAHLHDLVGLSVGATKDAAAAADGSVRAARLQAVKFDILAMLADESLTVAAIAARQGVTPRYVHKLFESDGTTFSQFILCQRLDRAYRMLRDRRFAGRSITAIAYDSGFGDLSYFNRTFRRRYNATPSDVRNAESF